VLSTQVLQEFYIVTTRRFDPPMRRGAAREIWDAPWGARRLLSGPFGGCRRRRSKPASRHRTYGANPLSIQARKRWTLSAGHGP
jgi:hypothetical protein